MSTMVGRAEPPCYHDNSGAPFSVTNRSLSQRSPRSAQTST
jgi:hypothetical protein